ncbi:hypothetical protein [Allosphingosinicella humi]
MTPEIASPDDTVFPGQPDDEAFLAEVDADHQAFVSQVSSLSPEAQALALRGRAMRNVSPYVAESIGQLTELGKIKARLEAIQKEARETDSREKEASLFLEAEHLKQKAAYIDGPEGQRKLREARKASIDYRKHLWQQQYVDEEARRLLKEEDLQERIKARAAALRAGTVNKGGASKGDFVAPPSFQP